MKKIQIEPTNRCNCQCVICRRTYWRRAVGDMTSEQFRSILDQLPIVQRVHLQGVGEPLLNDDLSAMVAETRKRGIAVGLNSNGSLLTMEKGMALLESGVSRINISLDTLDPHLFKETRPGPPLELVLKNLERMVEMRASGNFVETSLAVAVVAKQSTIASLPEVVEYAARVGVDLVYVQNLNYDFSPYEKVVDDCVTDDVLRSERYMQVAESIASEKGVRLLLPLMGKGARKCGWPTQGCNITWDGYVALCCLQPDPDVLCFGNVFAKQFRDIWHSAAYEEFRRKYSVGEETVCASCPALFGNMWHDEIAL